MLVVVAVEVLFLVVTVGFLVATVDFVVDTVALVNVDFLGGGGGLALGLVVSTDTTRTGVRSEIALTME